jgi:hypothetical protein
VKPDIHPATEADILALAPVMRAPDALEARRAAGLSPEGALRESVEASKGRAWAAWFDGQPACMFGLAQPSMLLDAGIPWLLTGPAVEKHPKAFFREARRAVERWGRLFPVLFQLVDVEHVGAQRFLGALGFEFEAPVPHGPEGALFIPAIRRSFVHV